MTAQEARTHIRYSGWASRKVLEENDIKATPYANQPVVVENDRDKILAAIKSL